MSIYLIIILLLFLLAAIDLIVGVSNDAVNFLNSAVGAKVAKFKVIIAIAGLGVLLGAMFSGGMMEVARKGIFNPQFFSFMDILMIFVAVMISDVIVLDMFNTFGLPTSTTVSIVFELLGAAVSIAFIKVVILQVPDHDIPDYINTYNAIKIIFGILFSVVVAFLTGLIVQYISRLIFSFNYEKVMKWFGSIWGGLITTGIMYFLFLKGLKHATFVTEEFKQQVLANQTYYTILSIIAFTVIIQLLIWFLRFNVLKFTVLLGTFALAMAFAGNDLVNFIGVPVAGYNAYTDFIAHPGADPNNYLMSFLSQKVPVNNWFLFAAGIIMILTLYFSKKAKSVIKTSVDLARQDEGYERFGSSLLARALVKMGVNTNNFLKSITPKTVRVYIQKRFSRSGMKKKDNEAAFDLIRASVNLFTASILIAIATTNKLPLSTTYVTFMVAMGTSLADRAWSGDSAVYRITGVITVIGGWFFTALITFTVAFTLAMIIYYGSFYAMFALFAIALYIIFRTRVLHKKIMQKEQTETIEKEVATVDSFVSELRKQVKITFTNFKEILEYVRQSLKTNIVTDVKKADKVYRKVIKESEKNLLKSIKSIQHITDAEISSKYVEFTLSLKQMNNSLKYIILPVYNHIDNQHKPLNSIQLKYIKDLFRKYQNFADVILQDITESQSAHFKELESLRDELIDTINEYRKKQVKFLKENQEKISTKANVLFFDIIYEMKILTFSTFDLYEVYFDLINLLKNVENKENQ
jgi:phosphate/sulfate permease